MHRSLIAAAALLAASPAFATGGFECRPVTGAGPVLGIAIGHTVAARLFSATLSEGGRKVPVQIGQSWIDSRHLWLDLVDPNATRMEAKLRATFQPRLRGRPAMGTLERGGRTYRVRCVEA
jgi:hypothetical protein